jgi:tetratricopeptide (TPR) repeat protein
VRVTARLGLALLLAGDREAGGRVTSDAARELAATEGCGAAAQYLVEAVNVYLYTAGSHEPIWRLAKQGLAYAQGRRDFTWAILLSYDLDRRESEDPSRPETLVDSPERREAWSAIARALREDPGGRLASTRLFHEKWAVIESRQSVLDDWADNHDLVGYWTGEFRRAVALCDAHAEAALQGGHLSEVADAWQMKARFLIALGDLAAAQRTLERACEVGERAGVTREVVSRYASSDLVLVRGGGHERSASQLENLFAHDSADVRWTYGPVRAAAALAHAMSGNSDAALRCLAAAVPAIERSAAWAFTNTTMFCRAARTLWELGVAEHAEAIERNLHAKTLARDFRYPHVDARLALAQLCALGGRHEEATEWFARARTVLDEQGARPLRAIVDFDEALALRRRDDRGDRARARPLLRAARAQFESVGMPGWLRRADRLARELG